ncbi:hypothetical protein RZO50_10090 [Microbacterium sp. SSW1-59]|uniref:hypothetical protein n=1 Tax=Microbacterium xanthum TaxID=3079794 RepID=UPI002AD55450|nr:hypothetical protein [Microbacterium sp. SSW1-59]MDZ8201870.1 hypothetical protein [Microbacterium sp. SSW1-59]
MSTPEQPADKPLTRRQLREIRNTGSTPVVTPPDADVDADPATAPEAPEQKAPAAPRLPRPAPPAKVSPTPAPDSSVNLGEAPLTRRQARQQEKIRTASVPVITPEVAAKHAASSEPAATPADAPAPKGESTPSASAEEVPAPDVDALGDVGGAAEAERPVVNPAFGAGLLAGGGADAAGAPASFDQLLSRSSSGSVSTPNALIMSQTPSTISSPVASTGEVILTGSYELPEGYGSTGHARGTADGKEVDAVLVDGELPAHSSPTPIAASAAISTHKAPGDVIRPPAPEKGGRLMLTLAITAGVLALALVGVLIIAFATGTI